VTAAHTRPQVRQGVRQPACCSALRRLVHRLRQRRRSATRPAVGGQPRGRRRPDHHRAGRRDGPGRPDGDVGPSPRDWSARRPHKTEVGGEQSGVRARRDHGWRLWQHRRPWGERLAATRREG